MLRENTADTQAAGPEATVAAAWLREGETLPRNLYRRPRFPAPSRGHTLPRRLAPIAVLVGVAVLATLLAPPPDRIEGRARAADGDSLVIGETRIRLLGLDAPEHDQICKDRNGADWGCGAVARQRLSALLAGGPALCQGEKRDRYGRLLATCTVGGDDVARILVAEGLALDSGGYADAERSARTSNRGMWAGQFVTPRRWREEGPEALDGESWFDRLLRWLAQLTG